MPPAPEFILRDLDTIKVLVDPVRTRIIQLLSYEPRSVQHLAAEMNVPFTRLYYHINLLEKHGLVRLVKTRALAGAAEEKYYEAAARCFVVDRAPLTFGDGDNFYTVMQLMLDETRADIERSIAAGQIDLIQSPPHPDALMMRRGHYRLNRDQAQALHQTLLKLLDETARGESSDPDDAIYSMTLFLHRSNLDAISDEDA